MANVIRPASCLFVIWSAFGVRRFQVESQGGLDAVTIDANASNAETKKECPRGTDPVVAAIQDVIVDYASLMERSDGIIRSSLKWFAGSPPELKENWKVTNTMQAKFAKRVHSDGNKKVKKFWELVVNSNSDAGGKLRKLVSRIWEHLDTSRDPVPMWNGKFWQNRGKGWTSEFGTANQKAKSRQTVTAISVPFVGLDRTAKKVVVGEGHGALSTALRKGECGNKSFEALTHAPANVFLTTYKLERGKGTKAKLRELILRKVNKFPSSRKQVRTGALGYDLSSNDALIKGAANTLSKIVKFALTQPPSTTKPRVRFTQLMADYPGVLGHAETGFIKDQTAVIDEFKQMLATTSVAGLSSEDVVELRYATNGWGLDTSLVHEDKEETRKVNQPAFFTYLRWVGEDLGELVKDMKAKSLTLDAKQATALISGKLLNSSKVKNVWDEYCVHSDAFSKFRILQIWSLGKGSVLEPDWLLKDPGNSALNCSESARQELKKDILGTTIRCHLNGRAKIERKTKHFQCWNRNLRLYSNLLGEKLTQNSAESRRLQKVQVALDILYQLQAQRKSTTESDNLACGGSCAKAHRTAELLQIAVLDTMLGILTFSNCKSGLDRTGLYHALQSAVDQIHILYPKCTLDLGLVAVHFWNILKFAASELRGGNKTHADRLDIWNNGIKGRSGLPKCNQNHHNLLIWEGPTGSASRQEWKKMMAGTSMHIFDIMRNAVLKNMLDVGMKITFSSTGMAGLKYGGYTAEYAAKKCKEAQGRTFYKDAQCKSIGADLALGLSKKLGLQREANPMIAPLLPNWVSFGSKVMPLAREHNGELYIANDLADVSEMGLKNPMTACALIQDAGGLRGS